MNQAHLHVLLTHGPVAGIFFGLLILGYGIWRSNRVIVRVGEAMFVLTGIFVIGLYLTGEGAEEVVENMATIEHDTIEAHESLARYTLIAGILLAVGALWALVRGPVKRAKSNDRIARGLFIAGILVAALISWTAYRGGRINHPEFRSDVTPDIPCHRLVEVRRT